MISVDDSSSLSDLQRPLGELIARLFDTILEVFFGNVCKIELLVETVELQVRGLCKVVHSQKN